MHGMHDLLQAAIHLGCRPRDVHCVLCHLQAAGGHATRIDGLARGEGDAMLHEVIHRLSGATHIAHLGHQAHATRMQGLGIGQCEFVLRGAGQGDIHRMLPRFAPREESGLGIALGIGSHDILATEPELQHIVYLVAAHTLWVEDITVGAAQGHHLGTHLGGLLHSTPGHVAEARDGHRAACDILPQVMQHLPDEVECTVACGLGTHERTAELQPFAGEGAGVLT